MARKRSRSAWRSGVISSAGARDRDVGPTLSNLLSAAGQGEQRPGLALGDGHVGPARAEGDRHARGGGVRDALREIERLRGFGPLLENLAHELLGEQERAERRRQNDRDPAIVERDEARVGHRHARGRHRVPRRNAQAPRLGGREAKRVRSTFGTAATSLDESAAW